MRYLTVFVVTALLSIGTGHAEAESVKRDGCAELASVVYSEVLSTALNGVLHAGPWHFGTVYEDVHICATTSETVSRAFTSAMTSAGHDVSWSGRGGDACLSGFLSQCYPNRSNPWDLPGDNRLVGEAWLAVSQSVLQQMHNPYSSNEVRFRSNELRLRLGLALRTVGDTR